MLHAIDIMNREPLVVPSTMSVPDLARLLLAKGADGACVVDDGKLVGVVTAMDLVFQDRAVHLPSFIAFIDALIPVGTNRTMHELEKINGSKVADIMSAKAHSVQFDVALDKIAGMMVDGHFSLVPVMKGETLIGVITRREVLLAHYGADAPKPQD